MADNRGADYHKVCLEKMCRICGCRVQSNRDKTSRREIKPYVCQKYVEKINVRYALDVTSDDPEIHPQKFCHRCYSKFKYIPVNKPYKEVEVWSPHTRNSCSVCNKYANQSKRAGQKKQGFRGNIKRYTGDHIKFDVESESSVSHPDKVTMCTTTTVPSNGSIVKIKMAGTDKEKDVNKSNGVNEEEDDDEEVNADEIESEGEEDEDGEEIKAEGSGELDDSDEDADWEPASKRQKTKRHTGHKSKKDAHSEDESEEVGDVLICEICDLKFDTREVAEDHKKQHENGTISNSGASGSDDAAVAERRRKLAQFTDEQILAKLVERQAAFVCVCGIIFRDQTLYYLHRGCHNSENPQQCSFCKFVAKDWYDFTTHFFVHKKNKLKSEEVEESNAT